MTRRAFVVMALVCSLSGCWLQPGFDAGRTNANSGETELTSSTVQDLTLLWDTPLPDVTEVNAPLSSGGRIYATAQRASVPGGDRVFALDVATGAIRWQTGFTVPDWGVPTEIYAPALSGDRLLVPWWMDGVNGGPGGLAALGLDGTVVDLPVVAGTTDVAVAAGSPASQRRMLDGSSGSATAWVDWTYRPVVPYGLAGPFPGSSFAIVGDRVAWSYGSLALGFSAACPQYPVPVAPTGCAPDWSTDLGGLPAPVAAVGASQVVYGDDTGTVSLLDMATGAVQWTAEVGSPVHQRGAVSGDTIVFATADGRVVALPAGGCGTPTCTSLWEGTIGGAATAPPLVGGDVVYATAGTRITAFPLDGAGTSTPAPLTTVTAPDPITGGPIVDGGRLLAATRSGHLLAYTLPTSPA